MFLDKFKLGVYNVGIIESPVEEILTSKDKLNIRWMKHKYKDRFFADPFLLCDDENNYYILAEEFPFYTDKAFISLLTVNKKSMKLLNKKTVITDDVHLSYPFIYKGKVIPEAFRSDRVYEYSLDNNLNVLSKKQILSQGLIDQTFLELDNKEWIFATDKDNKLCGLKIFYRSGGETEWHEHAGNPVKSDIRNSRPGGKFFKIGDTLYRPAQDSKKLYGHQIKIMRLDTLTTDTFSETEVKTLSSEGNKPFDLGFHTFNVENGFIVVDGYKEYYSFVIKPLCLKLPKLMKFLGEKICK